MAKEPVVIAKLIRGHLKLEVLVSHFESANKIPTSPSVTSALMDSLIRQVIRVIPLKLLKLLILLRIMIMLELKILMMWMFQKEHVQLTTY